VAVRLAAPNVVVVLVSGSNHATLETWVGSKFTFMARVKLEIGVPEVMAGGTSSKAVTKAPNEVIKGVVPLGAM